MEGGREREREEREKKERESISSCSLGCLPQRQFPLRLSLGRLGGEIVELSLAREREGRAQRYFSGEVKMMWLLLQVDF